MIAESLAAVDISLLELEGDGTALDACVRLGYRTLEDLYAAVAANSVTVDDLTGRLLPATEQGVSSTDRSGTAGA